MMHNQKMTEVFPSAHVLFNLKTTSSTSKVLPCKSIFYLTNLTYRPGKEYMIHSLGTKANPKQNYTLFFNICEYTQHKCSDAKTSDFANSVNNNQTCNHLSGTDKTEQKAKLLNNDYPEYGVNLKMIHGNACNAKKNY